MWEDPIVEETRAAREELLNRFNYDLDALCAYLEQLEKTSKKRQSHFNRSGRPPAAKHRNCPARANSSQKLTRPGFGPAAEPPREVKI